MSMSIMIQGTGSNVGKSLLVSGIIGALRARGLSVAPFKPQNMSNNAAATPLGGEIGRAQALQARAAGLEPHTDMNPVLLKPESETGAQIIVHGKRMATLPARDYAKLKPKLMPKVLESFKRLQARHDIIVIEGAGSPAEINLRAGDIANLGFAQASGTPVILAGDIDRGGVIAQLVGTKAVLPAADAALIKGFLVNKFRGDPSLFDDGLTAITDFTTWPSLGVIPWFAKAGRLPAEDILDLGASKPTRKDTIKIAVPQLSRIANFDDLDPLQNQPGVHVQIVAPGHPLPGDADLVILAGTKSTIGELAHFRTQGWDIDLAAHLRRGGQVIGICGGYQMLGRSVSDPDGIEGPAQTVPGLGHLNIDTVMTPQKQVRPVDGIQISDQTPVSGYEIHIGRSTGKDCGTPWLAINGKAEGAISPNGQIRGTYVHGLFTSDAFRQSILRSFDENIAAMSYDVDIDDTLDDLFAHIQTHMDLDKMLAIAKTGI